MLYLILGTRTQNQIPVSYSEAVSLFSEYFWSNQSAAANQLANSRPIPDEARIKQPMKTERPHSEIKKNVVIISDTRTQSLNWETVAKAEAVVATIKL